MLPSIDSVNHLPLPYVPLSPHRRRPLLAVSFKRDENHGHTPMEHSTNLGRDNPTCDTSPDSSWELTSQLTRYRGHEQVHIDVPCVTAAARSGSLVLAIRISYYLFQRCNTAKATCAGLTVVSVAPIWPRPQKKAASASVHGHKDKNGSEHHCSGYKADSVWNSKVRHEGIEWSVAKNSVRTRYHEVPELTSVK